MVSGRASRKAGSIGSSTKDDPPSTPVVEGLDAPPPPVAPAWVAVDGPLEGGARGSPPAEVEGVVTDAIDVVWVSAWVVEPLELEWSGGDREACQPLLAVVVGAVYAGGGRGVNHTSPWPSVLWCTCREFLNRDDKVSEGLGDCEMVLGTLPDSTWEEEDEEGPAAPPPGPLDTRLDMILASSGMNVSDGGCVEEEEACWWTTSCSSYSNGASST